MNKGFLLLLGVFILLSPLCYIGVLTAGTKATGNMIAEQSGSDYYVSEWNYTKNMCPWNDEAGGVAIDSEGNIIVAGWNRTLSTDSFWAVMKYSPNGTCVWNYTYDSNIGDDQAYSVAVDANDDFVVVGYEKASPIANDYGWRIMKFDKNGSSVWNYTVNISSEDDMPRKLAIDQWNNVIVVGVDVASSRPDVEWRIMKFSSAGISLWNYTVNISNNADVPMSVAVDSDNNITVVGYDRIGGNTDFEWRIMKFDKNGTSLWNYTSNMSPWNDEAWSVAIDHNDDVVAAGYDRTQGQYDNQWRIMKLSSNGTSLWNYTVNIATGGTSSDPSHDAVIGVAIDSFNNITAVGYDKLPDNSPGDFNTEWRIMKLGYDGLSLWNYTENFSLYDDEAKSVAIDRNSNDIVVTGFDSSQGAVNYQWRIMKFRSLYPIPEFPSFLILPLFMIATLLAVTVYRRKRTV
jgi:hypothetical protein